MTATTRRARREAELADRRDARRARRNRGRQSVWRSPMVLLTVGAVAVGAAIVAFSLLQQPRPPAVSSEITSPTARIPGQLADGRTLGISTAPVTVEIWSDFQCPACRSLATETERAIISGYVETGRAKLVYRDAAFQGQRGTDPSYDESVEAGAASRCAAEQGRFWQMHDWLFANWSGENQGAFRAERLGLIAEAAGLDMAIYGTCLSSGEQQAAVRAETAQAMAQGISSTPTLVINGQRFVGALSVQQLSQVIESSLP